MCRLGTEKEIRIEVDHRIGCARAIHTDGNPGVGAFTEITVHPQRRGDVLILGEEDLTHRNRLKRLLRYLTQYSGGIQSDLRALSDGKARIGWRAVVAEHVVHRRL